MPALEPRDLMSIGSMVVTLTGVIWALRVSVAKLEVGQTEALRLINALHKRLDGITERVEKNTLDYAVLAERVANLRATTRFRIPEEPVMSKDEGR